MAVGEAADVEHVAIEDPAEYAAMALRAALVERGITVKGMARAKHRVVTDGLGFLTELRRAGGQEDAFVAQGLQFGSCLMTPAEPGVSMLAIHRSARLGDDVIATNKMSQNLHAELLMHQLGRAGFCGKGSAIEGARMVRAVLTHVGIDGDNFVFYDGSGLSGHDLVTPQATAKLLAFAAT